MAKIKVLLLLCAFFLIGQYTHAQQIKRVVKAVLEYQDFTTTTIEDVHCEDFKATFGDSIRKIEIDNDSTLKCITKYALHFVEARKKPLDVRVLLTIFYNESKQEYCMNRFGLFYNPESGKYYKNEYLYKYIVDKCL